MTNTIYTDFLQILLTVTQTFTWFSGVCYAQKNDVKWSNKHNHLREVNAKNLHWPTNSLNEPILDPQGSYTDEQHSFRRRYA